MRQFPEKFALRLGTIACVAFIGWVSWGGPLAISPMCIAAESDVGANLQKRSGITSTDNEGSDIVQSALPSTPGMWEERVRDLVGKLASPRRAERATGERELIELGPDALEYFPAPSLITDVAAREALIRIRIKLERKMGEQSLTPRLVTLSGSLQLQDVVAAVAKQTGNSIDMTLLDDAHRERRVDIDWERQSFWHCIEALRKVRVELVQSASGPAQLVPLKERTPETNSTATPPRLRHIAISGPFHTTITALSWRGDVTDTGERVLRLRVEQQCEPRLRPLFGDFRDRDFAVSVSLAGGASTVCPPFNPLASQQPEFSAARGVEFVIDVIVPEAANATTLSLRQSNNITLAAVPIPVEFSYLDEPLPQTKRRGGVTVSLERIDTIIPQDANEGMVGTRAMIRMTSRYDSGGPAFESHRVGLLHRQLMLVNEEGGAPRHSHSSRAVAEGDGSFTLEYRFERLPPAWRNGSLIYEAPTAIITTPVTVVFENLPLPPFAP